MNETVTNNVLNIADGGVLLLLHNALHQFAPLNLTIGDIVLTERYFYFIRYYDFQYFGSLGKGAGFLVGGLSGGIASSISERDNLTKARNVANELRSKMFGFKLEERVKQYSQSYVYSIDKTELLQTSDEYNLSLTLRDGKYLKFVVPPMSAEVVDVISNWPLSKSLYDISKDIEGFFVGSASPQELLARVESGDSNAAAEVYKLGQQEEYAVTIYTELQSKTETKRQALYKVLAKGSEEFRKNLIVLAKKESFEGKRKIFVGSIAVVILVPFQVWIAISQDSILMWFAAPVFSYFVGMMVFEGAKQLKRSKEAKGHLG
jgi:hypothetical protein